jgi:chromosome segregation ATPase
VEGFVFNTILEGRAMSEAEQIETPQQVAELTEQLAHVRAKRDQLDAQNLRVTDNLRRTIEERDKAVTQLESLRAEYLAAAVAANTNSDKAAALQEQVEKMDVALRDMTAERDYATAQWEECCEDRGRQVTSLREQLAEVTASRDNFERLCKEWRIEFDAINAKKDGLQVELSQWQVGHDAVKEELAQAKESADMFAAENTSLQDTVRQLRARQIHDDLPGILMVIQLAAEQARELI